MILNTTSKDHGDQNDPRLYIPIDPSYLYPTNNTLPGIGYSSGISSAEYSGESSGYGLEHLMFQKQEIIHSKIQMLFSEIYQRHTLQNDNLYRISLDQCACRNLIFNMGDHLWDKNRLDFERKIIDLEQEKRREQTGYFKDVLFLRKELRETLIEKLEDKQKADLFKDSGEELTCNA